MKKYKIVSCRQADWITGVKLFCDMNSRSTLKGSFLYSNERIHENTYCQLAAMECNSPLNQPRVAIVTGESHILSMLPIVARHCETVMVNDIDPMVLENVQKLVELMQESNTTTEFAGRFYSSEFVVPKKYIGDLISNQLGLREVVQGCGLFEKLKECIDSMSQDDERIKDWWIKTIILEQMKVLTGEYWFLGSNKHFQKCKESLRRLQFCYTTVNLYDNKNMTQLSEYLRKNGATVTILNLSNVGDYREDGSSGNSHEKLETVCRCLPLASQPIILKSSVQNGVGLYKATDFRNNWVHTCIDMTVSRGLEELEGIPTAKKQKLCK